MLEFYRKELFAILGAGASGSEKNTKLNYISERFHYLAHVISEAVGSPWAFISAAVILVIWGTSGPLFGFSDTWQLIINTATTIVTFLMVFLIQNTQNRNDMATQLKLDELIRAVHGTRKRLVNLEDRTDKELASLHKEFETVTDEDETPETVRQ